MKTIRWMTTLELFKNKYVIFISFFRISGYVYMLFFPLYGMLLSMLFDILDWIVFSVANFEIDDYDRVDKPLDYLQYLFLIPLLFNTYIFDAFILLLAYRTIGQWIYFRTGNPKVFLLFPNFAEYLALLYYIKKEFNLDFELDSIQVILGILSWKLFQEYWIHIKPFSVTWNFFHNFRNKFSGEQVSRKNI